MLAMFSIGPMELILVLFIAALMVGVFVWPLWRICTKAGLPPALSLLTLLPFGIVIVLFIVALSDWPSLKQKTESLD
jgi:predicted PurR-regulated permease PerM